MSRTYFVDIDSTLLNTQPLYEKAQMELYGRVLPYEKVTHWYALKDEFGEGFFDIFTRALHPDWFHLREFYDGAVENLHVLDDMGFNIHIISHNPNPKLMYDPVLAWLQDVLDFPFQLTIFGARNSKIDVMKEDENAFGIIDDKPDTLKASVRAGFNTYAFLHPWNLTTAKGDDRIRGVVHWKEVPMLVQYDSEVALV